MVVSNGRLLADITETEWREIPLTETMDKRTDAK